MSARELVLSYEHGRWRAVGGELDVAHADLGALERIVEARWARPDVPVAVDVRFDLRGLPRWLLQYQAHYCNYRLLLSQGARP
jgi:hypothetical protein